MRRVAIILGSMVVAAIFGQVYSAYQHRYISSILFFIAMACSLYLFQKEIKIKEIGLCKVTKTASSSNQTQA